MDQEFTYQNGEQKNSAETSIETEPQVPHAEKENKDQKMKETLDFLVNLTKFRESPDISFQFEDLLRNTCNYIDLLEHEICVLEDNCEDLLGIGGNQVCSNTL
eukprot:TRINITY_DN13254_c0_g1_i1.p1 TRINITY_DN13254_c0_g1~~TRINITY_DN13254_c0_g1_i1.p1  ORF type:complete len:103 (-),score=21.67 TRINITY_DN13254_c0_g1_i1:13-321(-)